MKNIFIIAWLMLCFPLVNSTKAGTITVANAAQFLEAVNKLKAGDSLEVLDGKYDLKTNAVITSTGTEQKPVVIRAKNPGGVVFVNKSYLTLRFVSYVKIEGFIFRSKNGAAVTFESCTHCRVTKSEFKLIDTEENRWVYITEAESATEPISGYNRIDHNKFEDKSEKGNMITTDGFHKKSPQISQHDLIDHNYFRNVGPRIENGMETIRLGQGTLTGSSGFTTIEYNLFENCDGDAEIISVKCDSNFIRYNTFRKCQGGVCLRQSSGTIIEGNFFLGEGKKETGGVRVYRSGNLIFNNYFSGLTGSGNFGALSFTNGDHETFKAHEAIHIPPSGNIFAFNTLAYNEHNIEIGYNQKDKTSLPPKNNVIANNVIIGNKNKLINYYTKPVNQIWEGNLFYADGFSVLGIARVLPDQIREADPLLRQEDSIWRITKNSPAVNSAMGIYDFVKTDINGNLRDELKDAGAEEYSSNGLKRLPLKAADFKLNSEMLTKSGK